MADTVEWLAYKRGGAKLKPLWVAYLFGAASLTVALAIYPFMGHRRRAQILKMLELWEHQ